MADSTMTMEPTPFQLYGVANNSTTLDLAAGSSLLLLPLAASSNNARYAQLTGETHLSGPEALERLEKVVSDLDIWEAIHSFSHSMRNDGHEKFEFCIYYPGKSAGETVMAFKEPDGKGTFNYTVHHFEGASCSSLSAFDAETAKARSQTTVNLGRHEGDVAETVFKKILAKEEVAAKNVLTSINDLAEKIIAQDASLQLAWKSQLSFRCAGNLYCYASGPDKLLASISLAADRQKASLVVWKDSSSFEPRVAAQRVIFDIPLALYEKVSSIAEFIPERRVKYEPPITIAPEPIQSLWTKFCGIMRDFLLRNS